MANALGSFQRFKKPNAGSNPVSRPKLTKMSIQAKALRLGNWVKWGLVEVQVTEETAYRTYLKCKEGKVNGIELTPDVLEKFGFGLVNGYYVISHYDVDFCFRFADFRDDYGFYIEYTDSPFHSDENKKYFVSAGTKYLHQLQNLIFALTGEELNKSN